MSVQKIVRSRVAIFEKNGVYAVIALAITAEGVNAVSRNDPRNSDRPITHKAFETPAQADLWYHEYVIATVTENHWSIQYNGPQNFG